jgi:hypothetical protein
VVQLHVPLAMTAGHCRWRNANGIGRNPGFRRKKLAGMPDQGSAADWEFTVRGGEERVELTAGGPRGAASLQRLQQVRVDSG